MVFVKDHRWPMTFTPRPISHGSLCSICGCNCCRPVTGAEAPRCLLLCTASHLFASALPSGNAGGYTACTCTYVSFQCLSVEAQVDGCFSAPHEWHPVRSPMA
jgi:hypothetical protein